MTEPFALATTPQRKSFLAVEPFDALVINCHALAPQHSIQHRASPAPVHLRQPPQALSQLLITLRSRWMSKRASRDSDQPAGATLREMMLRHHLSHHLSLHRGP